MTTTTYCCLACREYRLRPEFRRVGLGCVCSSECLADIRSRTHRSPPRVVANPGLSTAVKAAVRRRDQYRCRTCGRRSNLHVHHINYVSEGADHSVHNLITLCDEHHGMVHSDKRRWQPICRAYIWLLYVENCQRFLIDIERQFATAS